MKKFIFVSVYLLLLTACGGSSNKGTDEEGTNDIPAQQNRLPAISTLNISVRNDEVATGSWNISDEDGDNLALTITSPPLHGELTLEDGYTYKYDPDDYYVGTDSLILEVSDSIDSVSYTISITIQAAPEDSRLLVSSFNGDSNLEIGDSKEFQITINDADGIQSLSIQLEDSTNSIVKDLPYTNINDLYTVLIDSSALSAGDYEIVATVVGIDAGRGDYSKEIEATHSITIEPPPADSPLLLSSINGDERAELGQTKEYQLTISDVDGVQSTEFELKNELNELIKDLPFTSTNDIYTLTLDTSDLSLGNYTIEARATGVDGGTGEYSAEKVETFSLVTIVSGNTEPNISNLKKSYNVEDGQNLVLSLKITDDDLNLVSWSVRLLPLCGPYTTIYEHTGTGDTITNIFFETEVTGSCYWIEATITDSGSGTIQEFELSGEPGT